jgi:hypothetical protein
MTSSKLNLPRVQSTGVFMLPVADELNLSEVMLPEFEAANNCKSEAATLR